MGIGTFLCLSFSMILPRSLALLDLLGNHRSVKVMSLSGACWPHVFSLQDATTAKGVKSVRRKGLARESGVGAAEASQRRPTKIRLPDTRFLKWLPYRFYRRT